MSYWEAVDQKFNGNMAEFARAMGVSRQLAYVWRSRGYVPAKRALSMQRAMEGRVSAQMVVEVAAEKAGC